MKKICLLILMIVILLCAGCINKNAENIQYTEITETIDSSSEISSASQESTEQIEQKTTSDDSDIPESVSPVEIILSEIEGEYKNGLFEEELRKTKRAVDAAKHCESVAIRGGEEGFYVLIGNGHEGMSVGNVAEFEFSDGKYTIQFEGYENNNLKIEYTPGTDDLFCETISYTESWSTEGQTIKFTKIADKNGDTPKLAQALFDGIGGVDILNDGVYANVFDKYYKIDVIVDYLGGDEDFTTYDGGLYLSADNTNLIMKYKYENGKIHLYDTDNMLVKTFE